MKCPYCAEEIKNNAIVCKHCGRDFQLILPILERIEKLENEVSNIHETIKNLSTIKHFSTDLNESQKSKNINLKVFIIIIFSIILTGLSFVQINDDVLINFFLIFSLIILITTGLSLGLILYKKQFSINLIIIIVNSIIISIIYIFLDYVLYRPPLLEGEPIHIEKKIQFEAFFIVVIFCLLIQLLSAIISRLIIRKIKKITKPGIISSKTASTVTYMKQQNQTISSSKLELLKIIISIIPPFLALIGTIITAILTYLSTVGK